MPLRVKFPSFLVSLVFIRRKQSNEEGRITIGGHENSIKKDCDKYLLAGARGLAGDIVFFCFLVFFFHRNNTVKFKYLYHSELLSFDACPFTCILSIYQILRHRAL